MANMTSCEKALKFVGRFVGPDGSFSLDSSSVNTRQFKMSTCTFCIHYVCDCLILVLFTCF